VNWAEVAVLLVSFVLFLGLGVPIAFCIGLSAGLTLLVGVDVLPAVTTLAQRIATGLDSFALLAIPFFVLAGQLMNRGGIARRLINFSRSLLGMLPGGLAYVHILAAMLFGAIAGSAVAAASAVGGMLGPRMREAGYDRDFAAVVNITSATTGLLIPPSNILIVYSLASGGVSIAALFIAGYLPGFLVGVLLMAVAGWTAIRKGYSDTIPWEGRKVLRDFADALASLFLIVIVIGGIVVGVFTATEAAAVAVAYAFILSVLIYREISWRELPQILLWSSTTTGVVMILIGTSMGMSWVMAYENIPQTLTAALISLAGGSKIGILLIVNAVLLLVGTVMDMTPAVLIFTPILLPIVTELGMDPIHFGIVMVLNLCVGLCTPPVGSVLFLGTQIAETSIERVIRPLFPFFAAMLAALLLVTFIPEISLFLPRAFGLL
jgi:tripartite ATP-independent transporter DctM subunit